jgi:hypothetical protein
MCRAVLIVCRVCFASNTSPNHPPRPTVSKPQRNSKANGSPAFFTALVASCCSCCCVSDCGRSQCCVSIPPVHIRSFVVGSVCPFVDLCALVCCGVECCDSLRFACGDAPLTHTPIFAHHHSSCCTLLRFRVCVSRCVALPFYLPCAIF